MKGPALIFYLFTSWIQWYSRHWMVNIMAPIFQLAIMCWLKIISIKIVCNGHLEMRVLRKCDSNEGAHMNEEDVQQHTIDKMLIWCYTIDFVCICHLPVHISHLGWLHQHQTHSTTRSFDGWYSPQGFWQTQSIPCRTLSILFFFYRFVISNNVGI